MQKNDFFLHFKKTCIYLQRENVPNYNVIKIYY